MDLQTKFLLIFWGIGLSAIALTAFAISGKENRDHHETEVTENSQVNTETKRANSQSTNEKNVEIAEHSTSNKEDLDSKRGLKSDSSNIYPKIVIAVPEPDELTSMSEDELIAMLNSWNPAYRESANQEIARRGEKMLVVLKKVIASDKPNLRASAASALAAIIKSDLRNWRKKYPNERNSRKAQEKILQSYKSLADKVLPLLKDEYRDVRQSSLQLLSQLGKGSDEVSMAILEMCEDKDEYLVQDAMSSLAGPVGLGALDFKKVFPYFKKAMKNPLPRCRGRTVHLISRLDDKAQRQCVPLLIKHLDWQPQRDTMFGADGQAQAIQILTKFKEKELVKRLPKLIHKEMRGPGLFDPVMASLEKYGPQAQSILPELSQYMKNLELKKRSIEKSKPRNWKSDLEKILQKIKRLNGVMNHVRA